MKPLYKYLKLIDLNAAISQKSHFFYIAIPERSILSLTFYAMLPGLDILRKENSLKSFMNL
jgi:hypothetical protein